MIQEDKELLLKDLCARLPYGVIVLEDIDKTFDGGCVSELVTITDIKGEKMFLTKNSLIPVTIEEIRPYLRSMSSMTEEEINECYQLQQDTINVTFYKYDEVYEKTIDLPYFESLVDFYNSHHLDYRGLIRKGLALEAPKEMYNIKKK